MIPRLPTALVSTIQTVLPAHAVVPDDFSGGKPGDKSGTATCSIDSLSLHP